jgi:hypothetical protein
MNTEVVKQENQQLAITPDQMILKGIEKGLDIDQLQKLMDLQDRWEKKNAEKAYNDAMSAVQKEIGAVKALKHNKQTGSKYAGIVDIDKAIRPHYTANGIAISFDTSDSPHAEHVRVLAHVTHRDGHKETRHIDIPADGKGAKGGDVMTKTHAVMSATTYGQRALLKMIFNIASGEFDDDGNGAGKPKEPKELPWLNQKTEDWKNVVLALKGSYKIEDIKKKFRISKENEDQLKNDVLA